MTELKDIWAAPAKGEGARDEPLTADGKGLIGPVTAEGFGNGAPVSAEGMGNGVPVMKCETVGLI